MSSRNAHTERLIQVLFKLIREKQSRQGLAKEFCVDVKTIDRIIDALGQEFPIIEEKIGREMWYGFADSNKLRILNLTPEETATMLLAQRSIAGIGITANGSQYAKYADSLLEKVRGSLPASIVKKMDELSNVYGSAVIPAKDFSKHTEIIDRLASSAIQQKKVEIQYLGLNSNEIEKRIVQPYSVYFDPDGATLKLVAFDEKRDRKSVFSVDRIQKINVLGDKFTRPNFQLKDYLEENCFNGIHGEPMTVKLKAKGVTARIFNERKFHPSQKVIERKQRRGNSPETITIELRIAKGRGLERFILGWLPDLEIVSPPELKDEIRQTLQKSLENF